MAFIDNVVRARERLGSSAGAGGAGAERILNVSTRSHDVAHHEAVIAWRTRPEIPAAVALRTEHAKLRSEVEVVIGSVDGRDEVELGLELDAIKGSKATVRAHAIERGCADQPVAERVEAGFPGITPAQCLSKGDACWADDADDEVSSSSSSSSPSPRCFYFVPPAVSTADSVVGVLRAGVEALGGVLELLQAPRELSLRKRYEVMVRETYRLLDDAPTNDLLTSAEYAELNGTGYTLRARPDTVTDHEASYKAMVRALTADRFNADIVTERDVTASGVTLDAFLLYMSGLLESTRAPNGDLDLDAIEQVWAWA